MKLKIISNHNLDTIKSNLSELASSFSYPTSKQLEQSLGTSLFEESGYSEIENIELDMSELKPYKTDFENVKRLYSKLKFLSDSKATDERLWAGLCLGPFWDYVKYRWNIKEDCKESQIKEHFFFGYSLPRSLMRNAVSRLWWIGRFTFDEGRSNPWELTEFICEHNDNIMNIMERSFSNNPDILRPFLQALLDVINKGYSLNTDHIGELAQYLNLLGGIYLLDCMPQDAIHDKIFEKAIELVSQKE